MATTKFKDKERENANLKAKVLRKKRRRRRTITALVVIFIITVITVCVLSLTVYFKIEKISVIGNNTYTAEEILSAADINTGDNLIIIGEKKISEKLKVRLPFIDKVEIEKSLPSGLKLIVTETKEEIFFSNDNNYFSANKKGKIIKKYDSTNDNLIKFTVSKDVKFKVGEQIEFLNEREKTLYNNYLNLINELDYKVSFINISDYFASYMKIDDRIIVKFGSSSYFENKVAYLKASLSGISNTAEGVFDLSAWTPDNNQPVLTYGDISSYKK